MLIKTKFSIGQRVYFPSSVDVEELIVSAIIVTKLFCSGCVYYRCIGSELLYPETSLYSSKFKCFDFFNKENKK